MFKEIAPTQTILDQIARVTGAPVDPSQIAIFETIALNTQPISKRGSLYEGAVATPGLLADMAAFMKAGGSVPLHRLHEQGYELPVGRVFMADTNGPDELRNLFYIPRNTSEGADLIAKINTSVIDEVSVGVQAKHLRCSECGWDYMGPDATMMNFFDRTCANDHVVGEGGVHLILDGLERWYETSLVSLGAAKNAKIVGRTRQILGKDEYNRLAASGHDPEILTLYASPTHKKDATMMADPNVPSSEAGFALVASLTAEKVTAQLALTTAQHQVADLTTQLTASATKVAELEAAVVAAAEGVALKADHEKLVAFLSEQTKAAMIAAGTTAPTVPATVDEMLAALEASKLKLHNLPKGPIAETAADTTEQAQETAPPANLAAFKLKH